MCFQTLQLKKEKTSQKSQEQAQAFLRFCFSFGAFCTFFPSTNLKDQYHGKLRYMDRTASLRVGDLSVFQCLIAPGTNHGSVHSLGAVEGQDQKKIYTLF